MKYQCSVMIDAPREKVVELFDNPDNMPKWQTGLVSFEALSGTPGQVGAKSRLQYKMGKRNIEMIETVITRNLPEEFSGSYEAKGVHNILKNYFKEEGNQTFYLTDSEFQFQGFMKIIGWLMPGVFKKQTLKFMKDFKSFVENER